MKIIIKLLQVASKIEMSLYKDIENGNQYFQIIDLVENLLDFIQWIMLK